MFKFFRQLAPDLGELLVESANGSVVEIDSALETIEYANDAIGRATIAVEVETQKADAIAEAITVLRAGGVL